MLTWMLVNTGLGLLALLFVGLNGSAPHRLRFLALFIVLLAWLVPWPLLPDLLPALTELSSELARLERAVDTGTARLTGYYSIIVQTGDMPVPLVRDVMIFTMPELALLLLCASGVLLFIWKLYAHGRKLRRLQARSADGTWLWQRAGLEAAYPLHVQTDIPGAFSSGLLRPRLWVHRDLANSPHVETVLQHELTHIRQHDNWYLLCITLAEQLFWWNPLVWYLGRQARDLQELSCDERCQRSSADYPATLAQLMLDSARLGHKPQHLALGANIFNKPNPNIKRIKELQRSYVMKTRHLVSAVVTAVTAVLGIGLVTAQPEMAQAVAGQRVMVVNRAVVNGEGGAQAIVLHEQNGVTEDVLMTAPQGAVRFLGAFNSAGGGVDQFVRIAGQDGEMKISFSFTDTPLPVLLSPLANMLNGAQQLPSPEQLEELRLAMQEDEAVIFELEPGQVQAQRIQFELESGQVQAQRVQWVQAVPAAPAGVSFATAAGGAVLMTNNNVVLEYPEAAERILTLSATNLTLDAALDLIAEESGCNIFRDGNKIVVDYCD